MFFYLPLNYNPLRRYLVALRDDEVVHARGAVWYVVVVGVYEFVDVILSIMLPRMS